MTPPSGLSETLHKKALQAGTDTEDLDRNIRPGNPRVETILATVRPKAPSSILAKGKAAWWRWGPGLPLLAGTMLTSAAILAFTPDAMAADGSYSAAWFDQWPNWFMAIDWILVSKTVWGVGVTAATAILALRSWRHRSRLGRLKRVAGLFDKVPDLSSILLEVGLRVRLKTASTVTKSPDDGAPSNASEVHHSTDEPSDLPSDPAHKVCLYAASRTGQFRSENQDAFEVTQCGPDEALIVVCDGVGGHPGGKEMAQRVSQNMTNLALRALAQRSEGKSEVHCLEAAITRLREQANNERWNGLTTLILAHIKGDKLSYATLGDGALAALFPEGSLTQLLTPHHRWGTPENVITAFVGDNCNVRPRIGTARLEPGTILMAMSDGVSGIVDWDELCANREGLTLAMQQGHVVSDVADDLLGQLEAARDPSTDALLHSDNMTLALALVEEADND